MVGCIIMVMLNNYPPNFIQNTFFRNQIHMPLAPARGLYLNDLCFDPYNKKNSIPEVLTFEDTPSIAELKHKINQDILSQDSAEWTEWICDLRHSIYHGIELVE